MEVILRAISIFLSAVFPSAIFPSLFLSSLIFQFHFREIKIRCQMSDVSEEALA
jgi:hypothetical protein